MSQACSACHCWLAQHVADMAGLYQTHTDTPNMTSLFGFWWHFDVTGQAPNVTSETLIKQTLSHTCSPCHWCLAQPVADVADFAVNTPKLTSLYGFVGFTKAPRQVTEPDATSETLKKTDNLFKSLTHVLHVVADLPSMLLTWRAVRETYRNH